MPIKIHYLPGFEGLWDTSCSSQVFIPKLAEDGFVLPQAPSLLSQPASICFCRHHFPIRNDVFITPITLSSGGYSFSSSCSARPLALWGFGKLSCKLSGAGGEICREDVLTVIAHRSPHSCTTKTRPLFCFLRDNRSLSPLLPNRPGTIAPKWKPFVSAYYLVSSCLENNDDSFSSLQQLPAFLCKEMGVLSIFVCVICYYF